MTEQGIDKASSFEAARARLLALAYRMLGSRAEAEDVVQDVWLKWHLADTQAVQTPAAWLTTLATRTAIDRLRHVQRERASQAIGWLPEPWLDEAAPSAEEVAVRASEMSYGVMLLLERLKPDERAAFVASIGNEDVRAAVSSLLVADGDNENSVIGAAIAEAAHAAEDEGRHPRVVTVSGMRWPGRVGRRRTWTAGTCRSTRRPGA